MAWQTPKTTWGQAGQTVPGVDDFNRIEGNIETLGRYDRAPGYGIATGQNAKSIMLDPAPGSYYDGLCFAFKNETQNTGAVTINVNGMGARPLKKPNGSDVATGYLKAGSIYTVRYNATTGNFILQGSDSTGNATPGDVRAGKTFSNDFDTDLIGTAVIAPPEFIYIAGFKMLIPSYKKSGTYAFAREGDGFYELGWDAGSSKTSQYAEITFATPIDVTNCSELHAVGRVESYYYGNAKHEAMIELNSEYYSGSGAGDRAGGSLSLMDLYVGPNILNSLYLTGKTGLYYLRLICRVTSSTYISDAYNRMYVHYIVLR